MSQDKIKRIALQIRHIRESKSYSQEYMAAKMGLSQNAYSKIELSRNKLTVARLLDIASLLQVNVSELIQPGDHYTD